jgi:hypothetical protein
MKNTEKQRYTGKNLKTKIYAKLEEFTNQGKACDNKYMWRD